MRLAQYNTDYTFVRAAIQVKHADGTVTITPLRLANVIHTQRTQIIHISGAMPLIHKHLEIWQYWLVRNVQFAFRYY